MKEKVLDVMSRVFGVSRDRLDETASPDTVEAWDSVRHVNLVLALEEAFHVRFTDDQMAEIISVERILRALEESSEAQGQHGQDG